jgi:hypothetical protein
MALEQRKVKEIVKDAVGKTIDVPEFQREFVWDAEQVKRLAESLYRDYPIGSFLLWNSSEYQEAKTAQGTSPSLWIVDGQQRITALCLLLGTKPYWWPDALDWNRTLEKYDIMVNIWPETPDGRLEFALSNPIRRKDPHWISLRQVLCTEDISKLTMLATDIARRLTNDKDYPEIFGQLHARLNQLWQVRERDIPIIKISHEIEDVAEIFKRLNQEGTRVKEADVILALAAVMNPGWVREEYLPFRNDLEEHGWDLDAGIFVRTLAGIGKGRARLIEVPKNFWKPETLLPVWKRTKEVVTDVLKRLTEFGIVSPDLLPSTNSLIPLFVLHHRWSSKPSYQFRQALYWFLLANRDGRYSESAITSLNEDVRTITEADNFESALANLQKRLRVSPEIAPDEFLNRYDRAGQRFLRLMLYLVLFHSEARDWIDGTRIGYDKTGAPLTAGFEPQWHHIYPRNLLRNLGFSDDEIHALANITVLNERTNVNKLSGKKPWDYLTQFNISTAILEAHAVPVHLVREPHGNSVKEQYKAFLHERALQLAIAANTLLQRLTTGS